MKIGIITHYDVHNHGAILQLNALVEVLKMNGSLAKALQFEKNYDFLDLDVKYKYNLSLRSLPFYLKYLKRKGVMQTFYNVIKHRKIDKFKIDHQLIGDYYSVAKVDLVIVGSDEVFALHTGPTPVFFGHALPCKTVISYAGCFGPTTYKDIVSKGCLELVSSGIASMNAISVRDQNSCRIVEQLTGKLPLLVCDPVILYGYKKEIEKMQPIHLPPYLLVYAYDNNMNDSNEVKMIKDYAENKGLKIVSAGFYHTWCDYNINVDPIELLNYFKCATEVITDTFHGSVMSMITNTQFAVITRNNKNKLCNLLEEYSLLDRIYKGSLQEIFNTMIDYLEVNAEIDKRRRVSMSFLINQINCV